VIKFFKALEFASEVDIKIRFVFKKTSVFAFTLFATVLLAQAQKSPEESQLRAGQCYSIPDSKTYLKSLQANPGAYPKMISELGSEKIANLQNTDSTNYYFCQVKCKNLTGLMETFWTTLSDSTARFSDMNGFLCSQVTIENVQIVGSIYGPQPVIHSFWAFESNLPETYQWLRKIDFKLPLNEFNIQLKSLRITLNYIASSYMTSTSPVLKRAGETLSHFADGTDQGDLSLIKYVLALAETNWSLLKLTPGTEDYFTFLALNPHARFVEYGPTALTGQK